MTQDMSRIILPRVGPVCAECFSRGHVAEFPVSPGEIYSFGVTEPQAELSWNVDAARALIAVRPRAAQRLDRAWLERWLAERTSFTEEHLDHIPSEKLDAPGILVELLAGPPARAPEPFRILIDGTHRAARLLQNSMDVWAYLLTEDEQRAICTYRAEGRVVEMPTFPGPGITDRQAGIFVHPSSESDVA